MKTHQPDSVRQLVRQHYGKVATGGACGCSGASESAQSGCCGSGHSSAAALSAALGYSQADLAAVFYASEKHQHCIRRVGDGAEGIAELISEKQVKGELLQFNTHR